MYRDRGAVAHPSECERPSDAKTPSATSVPREFAGKGRGSYDLADTPALASTADSTGGVRLPRPEEWLSQKIAWLDVAFVGHVGKVFRQEDVDLRYRTQATKSHKHL